MELLVVIGVIAILVVFLAPAMSSIVGSSQITHSLQMVEGQLSLARMRALSRNRPVEVRFYRFGDPEIPGEDIANPKSGRFRAMQFFELVLSGTAATPSFEACDRFQRLESTVVFDSGDALSTILNQPQRPIQAGATLDPRRPIGLMRNSYEFTFFRFNPDGSADLPIGNGEKQWFLTLHALESGDALSEPPKNFATIQVDPLNGSIRSFRP